jgi:CheY-like chemotaxis protein
VNVVPNRRGARILIVGEEPSGRDGMRVLLGSTGCECTIVSKVQQELLNGPLAGLLRNFRKENTP